MQEKGGGVARSGRVTHEEDVVEIGLDVSAGQDLSCVGYGPSDSIPQVLNGFRESGFRYEAVVGDDGEDTVRSRYEGYFREPARVYAHPRFAKYAPVLEYTRP